MIKITKKFKGLITEDGDDGFCWGVHFTLYGEKKDEKYYNTYHKEYRYSVKREPILPNPINWLDEIAKQHPDKKIKIKIEVEIE